MKTFTHLWQYLAEFFLEWEMFQIKVVEKVETHILRRVPFLRAAREIMWKNMVEPERSQMTIRRMRSACLVSNATREHAQAPSHAHAQIHNTCRISTATTVAWTFLSVMLYVHCLSCYCKTINTCVPFNLHSCIDVSCIVFCKLYTVLGCFLPGDVCQPSTHVGVIYIYIYILYVSFL